MSNQDLDLDEKPLDPATEKVRKKMVRLLGVSIGVMMIGLMAVLGAIIYKFSTAQTSPENRVVENRVVENHQQNTGSLDPSAEKLVSSLELPQGAKIISTSLNGGEILLHLEVSNQSELWVYNILKNKVVATIKLR